MDNGMVIFLCAGLFVAGVIAEWILLQIRNRRKERIMVEVTVKLQAYESMITELRQQIEQKDNFTETLRDNIAGIAQAKTIAETKRDEAVKSIEEQKKLLARAEEKMINTFQALSGESLKSNNKAFLELAQEALNTVISKAKGDWGEKEESVKNIIGSLEDALRRYEKQLDEMESKRAVEYGSLDSQIKSMVNANEQLKKETGNLVNALKRPEVRGRWGEITLRRVVELAGMMEHCDFTEQISVNTESGRIRPDMIIHLPADREIVVDSKVSLDAYMDAVAVDNDEERRKLITKHAQQIKKHMSALSAKNYWAQFSKAPDFVVMFVPGESFLSSALSVNHNLIEEGMKAQVVIASPVTLIGLLRTFAYGWRQEQVTKHAHEIAVLGKEIYKRFQPWLEHINNTGGHLEKAVDSFNKMITSLEHRVLVSARKFRDMGAGEDKELPELKSIEHKPIKTQKDN